MKMLSKIALLSLSLSLMVSAHALAGGLMREGMWEITSKMDMPGMPQMPGMPKGMAIPGISQPMKMKQCFRKEDVRDDKNVVPKDNNCKITRLNVSGNKVSWAMKCTGENPSEGEGEATYHGDSYEGVTHMRSPQMPGEMVATYSGRRVGDCK